MIALLAGTSACRSGVVDQDLEQPIANSEQDFRLQPAAQFLVHNEHLTSPPPIRGIGYLEALTSCLVVMV